MTARSVDTSAPPGRSHRMGSRSRRRQTARWLGGVDEGSCDSLPAQGSLAAGATVLLSVLAASVIALALVAEASSFGSGFTTFALILLPVMLFLGLTTYIRLVAINHDETRWVLGMNRIRAAYLELAPELERWFITSHHDDEKGAAATAGWMTFPTLFGYVTTPAAVGMVDAVIAGVITFLATRALGLQAPAAAALGVLIAVVLNLALTAYSRWAYRRWRDLYPPVSPTPHSVR